MASGFPSWDDLNLSLLESTLNSLYQAHPLVERAQIRALAQKIYEQLGRDAAADFAFQELPEPDFYRQLGCCLYGGSSVEPLPVLSVQKQLAAMALQPERRAELFTTNFEPLLELALAQLAGDPSGWQQYRYPLSSGQKPRADVPQINHVHGWIEPNGKVGGTLILTESSFLALRDRPEADANKALDKLFGGEHPALVVGMSLADPNLRRVLHRRRRDDLRRPGSKVFVIMNKRGGAVDACLRSYWRRWKLDLIDIDRYDYIPDLLRQIVWGPSGESAPAWFATSRQWVQELLPEDILFGDDWQRFASRSLDVLSNQVRNTFAVPEEEQLIFSLFLPQGGGPGEPERISVVASSRICRKGTEARRHVAERSLLIRGKEKTQGVGGLAFRYGNSFQVLDNDAAINRGFDPAMVAEWGHGRHYRDWRSIFAVPVLDSPHWLPFSVLTMTSNCAVPFWARFGERGAKELANLEVMMRRTAKWMVANHGLAPASTSAPG